MIAAYFAQPTSAPFRDLSARFRNMDADRTVHFFERIGGRWVIGDIANLSGRGRGTLSPILRRGHAGGSAE